MLGVPAGTLTIAKRGSDYFYQKSINHLNYALFIAKIAR
ncbi:hypothetical protein HSIEG1_1233 [Enterococcus sp. HSIEG1]|nr:hypothetical protein HSIEG1_1233 [Enterococcus sp. HSIEG1]